MRRGQDKTDEQRRDTKMKEELQKASQFAREEKKKKKVHIFASHFGPTIGRMYVRTFVPPHTVWD